MNQAFEFNQSQTTQEHIKAPVEFDRLAARASGREYGLFLRSQFDPKWADGGEGHQTGRFTVELHFVDTRGHETIRRFFAHVGDKLVYSLRWLAYGTGKKIEYIGTLYRHNHPVGKPDIFTEIILHGLLLPQVPQIPHPEPAPAPSPVAKVAAGEKDAPTKK